MKMVKAKLNGKWEIIIPDHRAERPEWHTVEGWERARIEALVKYSKGKNVLYIGAEEADIAGIVMKYGAKSITLVEPNPKVWGNIKAIWKANKLPKPFMYFGFCSNATKKTDNPELDLSVDDEGWTVYANDPPIGAHGFKELDKEADNYPQITVDDLVAQTIEPDVITFDVEGSEFEVLKGAEKTIEKYKPVILASIHPEILALNYNAHSRDVRNWIIGKGYKETILDYNHELHVLYEAN